MLSFFCLCFPGPLSTSQLATPNFIMLFSLAWSDTLTCFPVSPSILFSCISHLHVSYLAPDFPFHFSKSLQMPGDFCTCLSLSSDSIPLPTHWFCPLAYPKLTPLECVLPCLLWELSLVARTAFHHGGYRPCFSDFPVCLFHAVLLRCPFFSYATLQSIVMPIPDFTTDLSEYIYPVFYVLFSSQEELIFPKSFSIAL